MGNVDDKMTKKRMVASAIATAAPIPGLGVGFLLRALGVEGVTLAVGIGLFGILWLALVAFFYWRSVGIIPWSGKPWINRTH